MRVEIQLQPEAALSLQKRGAKLKKGKLQDESDVSRLVEAVEELGLKLEPVHPHQTHPLLTPYYMIEVPDRPTAERVIEQISKNKIVEAAYLPPEESLP